MKKLYPVFASHSSTDKSFLHELSQKLEEQGIQIWEDKQVIRVGEIWQEPAKQGIRECQVFLPIITPAALNSPAVQQEMGWREEYGKPLIPVMLEKPANWEAYTHLKNVTYADFQSWHQKKVIDPNALERLIDGINTYRLQWFNELLVNLEIPDQSAQEAAEIIRDMALRLGDRALPEFAERIFVGVNTIFEPPESEAIFYMTAKIGGEFAKGILELAFGAYHPGSVNAKAIIKALGHVGDLTTEMMLNQRLGYYEREPNAELARETKNAMNRIRTRRLNVKRGTNHQPRDI